MEETVSGIADFREQFSERALIWSLGTPIQTKPATAKIILRRAGFGLINSDQVAGLFSDFGNPGDLDGFAIDRAFHFDVQALL